MSAAVPALASPNGAGFFSLSEALDSSPEIWMGLQSDHDLGHALGRRAGVCPSTSIAMPGGSSHEGLALRSAA